MECSVDNIELLLTCKRDKLNSVSRYTDCEVSVLWLIWVLHSIQKLILTEYVYVQVVSALIEVTIHSAYKLLSSLSLIMTKCRWVHCLSI